MANPIKTEPVMVIAAVLTLLQVFGVELLESDAELITQAALALITLVSGFIARSKVSPVAKVEESVNLAYSDIDASNHPGNPFVDGVE